MSSQSATKKYWKLIVNFLLLLSATKKQHCEQCRLQVRPRNNMWAMSSPSATNVVSWSHLLTTMSSLTTFGETTWSNVVSPTKIASNDICLSIPVEVQQIRLYNSEKLFLQLLNILEGLWKFFYKSVLCISQNWPMKRYCSVPHCIITNSGRTQLVLEQYKFVSVQFGLIQTRIGLIQTCIGLIQVVYWSNTSCIDSIQVASDKFFYK